METCVRPSCDCKLGEKAYEVDGKTYCCKECYEYCTDEKCNLDKCPCAK